MKHTVLKGTDIGLSAVIHCAYWSDVQSLPYVGFRHQYFDDT